MNLNGCVVLFSSMFLFHLTLLASQDANIYDNDTKAITFHDSSTQNIEVVRKLTIKDVLDLISDLKITTVEELIENLPEWYRSGFALVHTSRSLQGATHLNPRAILTGYDQGYLRMDAAGVVLAFSGDPSLPGYNTVEMVEFDEASKTFEFRIINFDTSVTVSDPNPPQCLLCHARGTGQSYPIWDSYFRWPGTYGAMDGHIYKGSYEDIKFREFLNAIEDHPRYKFLPGLDNIRFDESKYEFYERVSKIKLDQQEFKHPNGYFVEPYMGFGLSGLNQVFDVANAKRIVDQIVNSASFEQYKKLVYCAVLDTQDATEAFGLITSEISQVQKQRFDFEDEMKRLLLTHSAWPLTEGRLKPNPAFLHRHIDRLFFITSKVLEVNPFKWSLNFSSGVSLFSRPTTNSLSWDVVYMISNRPDFKTVTTAPNFINDCKAQLIAIK